MTKLGPYSSSLPIFEYHLQNSTRKEVKMLLDTKNVVELLAWKLLALFEKIEQEAMKGLSSGRTTNAEGLWNNYIQTLEEPGCY